MLQTSFLFLCVCVKKLTILMKIHSRATVARVSFFFLLLLCSKKKMMAMKVIRGEDILLMRGLVDDKPLT